MKTEVVTITPEMAEEWLKKNIRNIRPLRKAAVSYLAAEITAGKWELTHQGIAFGADGILVDGQHRLAAIARAGVPVECMVTWGIQETGTCAIDSGTKRSFGARLGMSTRRAAVMAAIARIRNCGAAAHGEFDPIHPYDVARADAAFGEVYSYGETSVRRWSKTRGGLSRSPQVAAMTVLLSAYPDHTDQLTATFNAFIAGDVSLLSPVELAYWRQCHQGVAAITVGGNYVVADFARAWAAFDPSRNSERHRLCIREPRSICRDVAKSHIIPAIKAIAE